MNLRPREVITGYGDQGLKFAEQLQQKLLAKYKDTVFTQNVFNQIIGDIKTDMETDNLIIIVNKMPLNPEPYPNFLKILYQVVTRLGHNFWTYATVAGFVNGMSFLQLHELLFQDFPNLVAIQTQP